MKAMEYMEKVKNAAVVNFNNGCEVYYGKSGAKRLAREFAYGLNDVPYKEALDALRNSYSGLFVKLYVFGPFLSTIRGEDLDAKEWSNEILKQLTGYKWEQLKKGQKLIVSNYDLERIKIYASQNKEEGIFNNLQTFNTKDLDSLEISIKEENLKN